MALSSGLRTFDNCNRSNYAHLHPGSWVCMLNINLRLFVPLKPNNSYLSKQTYISPRADDTFPPLLSVG